MLLRRDLEGYCTVWLGYNGGVIKLGKNKHFEQTSLFSFYFVTEKGNFSVDQIGILLIEEFENITSRNSNTMVFVKSLKNIS